MTRDEGNATIVEKLSGFKSPVVLEALWKNCHTLDLASQCNRPVDKFWTFPRWDWEIFGFRRIDVAIGVCITVSVPISIGLKEQVASPCPSVI